MSFPSLFRLPAGLRAQAYADTILQSCVPRRNSRDLFAKRYASSKSPLPRPTRKAPVTAKSTGTTPKAGGPIRPTPPQTPRASLAPSTPPTTAPLPRTTRPEPSSPATRAPPPIISPQRSRLSYTDRLFEHSDEILLYQAPSHTSFFISSYLFGGTLLLGSYLFAQEALKTDAASKQLPSQTSAEKDNNPNPTRLKWWVTPLRTVPVIFLVIASTTFLLAPSKLIKSITALSPRTNFTGQVVMRCRIKSKLGPVWREKTIDVPASDAFVNHKVIAQGGNDIDFTSIPMKAAERWTHGEDVAGITSGVQRGRYSRAWRAVRDDVQRMWLREGILTVRFADHGSWKVDLTGCKILDYGQPLLVLMQEDRQAGSGLVAWSSRWLGKMWGRS